MREPRLSEPTTSAWRSGRGVVVARAISGRTVLPSTRAESPLKLLRPVFPGTTSAAVCIVTFGGGLVDGDDISLDVDVGVGATLLVLSQASTKVFRGAARQALRARVDGTLVLLPDPVSAFAGARYVQRVDVSLGASGACVLLDGFTSGRAAFGERWAMTELDLRTSVTTHDGRPIVVDALRFARTDGELAERADAYEAFATLLAVGAGAAPVVDAIVRDPVAPPTSDLVVATSPLPRAQALGLPGAVARVAASSPSGALTAVRSRLRSLPAIDAVDPFELRH